MCLGHATLTTDREGGLMLLSRRQLQFQDRTIVFAPFHDGGQLDSFQNGLNQRRLFVILKANPYSPQEDIKAKSDLARLNSSFGAIESQYFRKVPSSSVQVYVVVFCNKSARKKALEFYREHPLGKQQFAVISDVLQLKTSVLEFERTLKYSPEKTSLQNIVEERQLASQPLERHQKPGFRDSQSEIQILASYADERISPQHQAQINTQASLRNDAKF